MAERYPRKVAVISHVLPPSATGQALMLSRLLGHRAPETYVQISARPAAGTGRLHGRQYRTVPVGGARSRATRPARLLTLPAAAALRTAHVAAILQREQCDAVVACTGDLLNLPTAAAASRLACIPFHAYLFDDYVFQWPSAPRRWLAERLAPRMLGASASVIVPNAALADSLERRYGIRAVIVPNACDTDLYAGTPPPVERGTVVYTGAVYGAQVDSLRRISAAIATTRAATAKLVLYTAASEDEIRSAAFSGPVEIRGHLAPDRIPAAQRAADVLVLPLAFTSRYHDELVRTSAPAKMAEYLASRRPVLVHAPRDSFVASYFREHGCGLVVDSPDHEAVAEGLSRLLEDEALRTRLTDLAWERARAEFDTEVAVAAFEGALTRSHGDSRGRSWRRRR